MDYIEVGLGELEDRLKDYGEWAENNLWKVPMMLPNALYQAADIVKRYNLIWRRWDEQKQENKSAEDSKDAS